MSVSQIGDRLMDLQKANRHSALDAESAESWQDVKQELQSKTVLKIKQIISVEPRRNDG